MFVGADTNFSAHKHVSPLADEIKSIDQNIRKTVSEAADFAETSPEPDMAELYTDVLVEQY